MSGRCIYLTLIIMLSTWQLNGKLNVSVSSEAAILINADTGAILYEKNAYKQYYPASITKIASAAYALSVHKGDMEELIPAPQDCIAAISYEEKKKANFTFPSHWVEHGSTHIGIKKGEELSFKDLMYGMMIASGNDAANVIAHYISGSVPNFTKELNAYIRSLGCRDTVFHNPHGLYHPEHQCTAYDMAIISREALKNPVFRDVVSTVRYRRPKTNKQEATTLLQGNRLLRKGDHYNPKVIGIKIGYIANACHTFVAAAEHEGRTLIAVLLKAKERDDKYKDANKLFDAAFNEEKVNKVLLKSGIQKYALKVPGTSKTVQTHLVNDVSISYFPSEEPKVKCLLYWETNLQPPIRKNQAVGSVQLCNQEGELLQSIPLLAHDDVGPTLSHSLKSKFRSFSIFKFFGCILLFGAITGFLFRFKKG